MAWGAEAAAWPRKKETDVRIIYRSPTVTSTGGRDGGVRSADGFIDLQVAIPKEMGGPGGKTNPEELFAAGYAACFHSAVKRVAADKKIAIGNSVVEAQVAIGPGDSGPGYTLAVALRVILPERRCRGREGRGACGSHALPLLQRDAQQHRREAERQAGRRERPRSLRRWTSAVFRRNAL